MHVILFTEQCLQDRLHLSVKMMVPNIGVFRLKITVVNPYIENLKKDDSFINPPFMQITLSSNIYFKYLILRLEL